MNDIPISDREALRRDLNDADADHLLTELALSVMAHVLIAGGWTRSPRAVDTEELARALDPHAFDDDPNGLYGHLRDEARTKARRVLSRLGISEVP